jgi:hypothetical protein
MAARAPTSSADRGYGTRHQRIRAAHAPLVLAGGVRCARCGELIAPNEEWDMGHVDGDRSRYSGPEHAFCNRSAGGTRGAAVTNSRWAAVAEEEEPEADGIAADDERWNVPWIAPLRVPPPDATWPRYMTAPHPRAVDSLGAEFVAWSDARTGRELRWWQRLVATRLLEVDDAGALVWTAMVLSMARQLGKSWLLRELMLWRIHQGVRFGEPQDVMHTGKDIAICKEVQRPARYWAKARPALYKVREVNGQEEIEHLPDGSRWMLRAKEAVYGYSVGMAAVDEGWKVRSSSVDEGLEPTMTERLQPQLLLVSTAHRLSTALMLERRAGALTALESGAGDLIVEWSVPRVLQVDDRDGWRLASPHWTPQRERLIARKLEAMRAGEIEDPEEPDPEASFRAQWLNQWPRTLTPAGGPLEELLPAGMWAGLAEADVETDGPIYVAVEDDFGRGAAVAAASRDRYGRIEVDGWLCKNWDAAMGDVQRLAEWRQVRSIQVGASLLDRAPPDLSPRPKAAAGADTRNGLAVFRDLAADAMLVHDQRTFALDDAIKAARVRGSASGLRIAGGAAPHLVKAAVWAVAAAHRPVRLPAVY